MEERGALALGIALISELCLARLPLPPLLARARVRVVLPLAVGAPRLVHREELRLALPPRLLERRKAREGLGVRRVLIAVRRVHVHVLALMVRWVPLLLLGR